MLIGLFLFAGGGLHYVALVLGHKRQRDFVERYIRQARTLAWGDASPLAGVPGIDSAGSTVPANSPLAAEEQDAGNVQTMNRRERRMQERQSKKPSAASRRGAAQKGSSGTSTPRTEEGSGGAGTPVSGPKKRVQAENGKILVVDSVGNVFLEEEDEEGNTDLFLLDPEEVEKPSFKQTVVVQLPLWVVGKVMKTIFGGESGQGAEKGQKKSKAAVGTSEVVEELDGFVNVTDEEAEATKVIEDKKNGGAGAARKRKSKIS